MFFGKLTNLGCFSLDGILLNISVVVNEAHLCHTSFQSPEYLTLHQSPQACIMQALLHGYEYLTIYICHAELTFCIHIHGVS